MNTRKYMIILKGKIATAEIVSCRYNEDTKKWDVKFNNGNGYLYNYANVEVLTDPVLLKPNMYRITRDGHEFNNVTEIYVFKALKDSYLHICFGNGSERDYCRNDLEINESILSQGESAKVFEYIKKIAELSNIKNENTGERLLKERFEKISFVSKDVALAKYLEPSSVQTGEIRQKYIPIFPFGCNNSQYRAVQSAMENHISVI